MSHAGHSSVDTHSGNLRRWIIVAAGVMLACVVGWFAVWEIQQELRKARVREAHSRARLIRIGLFNYIDNRQCLPEVTNEKFGGWREQLFGYIDASPIPPRAVIQAGPAGIFNLVDHQSHAADVYAVTGADSAFAPEQRCRLQELPRSCLLFVSGGASSEPWYAAADISVAELRGHAGPIRDIAGETLHGVVFVIFADGKIWAIDSATPCELLARCASVNATTEIARTALTTYRLTHYERKPAD